MQARRRQKLEQASWLAKVTILSALGFGSFGSEAAAHTGRTKLIRTSIADDGVEMEVRLPALATAVSLGLATDVPERQLASEAELLTLWLAARIKVSTSSGFCSAERRGASVSDGRLGSGRSLQNRELVVSLFYRCPTPMGSLVLRDESLIGRPEHETVVAFGKDRDGAVILRDGNIQVPLDPRNGSLLETAATFVGEGARHLVTGYDHLLFLVSLILVTGLVGVREGARKAFSVAGAVVTAFTLGHSVTLVLAALDLVVLPIGPVEATIALSIVVAAALNLSTQSHRAARPGLAFGFGLIHGFGFSSVLAEVGLPTSHRIAALFAFNLGIELAQLLFVAVLLVPLLWLARFGWYPAIVIRGGSAITALLGLIWFAERTNLL